MPLGRCHILPQLHFAGLEVLAPMGKRARRSEASDAVAARVLHVGQASIVGLHKILQRLREGVREDDLGDLSLDLKRLKRVNLDRSGNVMF